MSYLKTKFAWYNARTSASQAFVRKVNVVGVLQSALLCLCLGVWLLVKTVKEKP